ncbi:MAG: autotransporter domain-containing protein [Phycisphaeraceae bacterium]
MRVFAMKVGASVLCALMLAAGSPQAWARVAGSEWTGTAGDGNWSTPGNWAYDAVPSGGGWVDFSVGSGTLHNDLQPDLPIESIYFRSDAGPLKIVGNRIQLGHEVEYRIAAKSGSMVVSESPHEIELAVDAILAHPTEFNVRSTGELHVSGILSGEGALGNTGPGTLRLSGENTFTGDVVVLDGTLLVENDQAAGVGESLIFGDGVSIGTTSRDVALDHRVDLAMTGARTLHIVGDHQLALGQTVLGEDTTLDVAEKAELVLAGVESGESGPIYKATGEPGPSINSAPPEDPDHQLTKTGLGTLRLAGANTFTGGVYLQQGTLLVEHDQAIGDGGPLVLSNGAAIGATTRDVTLDNAIDFADADGSVNVVGDHQLTLAEAITLPGVMSFDVADEAALVLNGVAATGEDDRLSKHGAGTLELRETTEVAAVTVHRGTLALSGRVASNLVRVNGDGTLYLGPDAVVDAAIRMNGGVLSAGDHGVTLPSLEVTESSGEAGFGGTGEIVIDGPVLITPPFEGGAAGASLMSQPQTDVQAASRLSRPDPAWLTLNVRHPAGRVTVNGATSLAHNFRKAGPGTLEFTDDFDHEFLHTSSVLDGELVLNADMTVPTLAVEDGASLSGSGSITGDVFVRAGATHRAGNSIGTRQVDGNYRLAGVEEIETDGEAADRVTATGDITLTDTAEIRVIKIGTGVIDHREQYVIYDAEGDLNVDPGAAVTDNSDFLDWFGSVAEDDPTQFVITARQIAHFDENARGRNRPLGVALQGLYDSASTPEQARLLRDLQAMDLAGYNQAIEQLSPGQQMAPPQTAVQVAEGFNDNLGAYFGATRAGVPSLAQQTGEPLGLQFASAASDPAMLAAIVAATEEEGAQPAAEPYDGSRVGGFAKGFGIFSDQDTTADRIGFTADTGGAMAGIDRRIGENALVGFMLGYGHTELDFAAGRGEGEVDTFRVGPYTSLTWRNWLVDASASFGYHTNDIDRRITAGGIDLTANADYDAWDVDLYLRGGYAWELTDRLTLTPTLALEYLHYEQDGYVETGGAGANLAVDESDSDSLRSVLGVTAAHRVEMDRFTLVPEMSLGWAHEYFGDTDLSARFVGGATSFVTEEDGEEDSLLFGAGATALFGDDTSAFLRYDGEYDSDGEVHAITGGVTFRF